MSKARAMAPASSVWKGDHAPRAEGQLNYIPGFQNFLAHSAETFMNIKANISDTGDVNAEFELNLEPYSTLLVVAVSEEQSTHKITNTENLIMPQRDISLTIRKFSVI